MKTVQDVEDWIDQDPPEQLAFAFNFAGLSEDDVVAIKQCTLDIRDRVRRGAELTVGIGDALRDVKRRLERGKWAEYLDQEFGMSVDTADRLIAVKNLAEQSPEFAQNLGRFQKSTQYLLVQPSTPAEAKAEILGRGASGEEITKKTARKIISEHKPKPAQIPDEYVSIVSVLTLLRALRPEPMQNDDLVASGFSQAVIDRAVEERLINRTFRGKCTYVWTLSDVVQFVTAQGSVTGPQLQREGCQAQSVAEAEREGLIVRQGSVWTIPNTGGRKAGVEPKEKTSGERSPASPGGNTRPVPDLEQLLKGAVLSVTFTFGAVPGKIVVGVRVKGHEEDEMAAIILEAPRVPRFPDEVMDLIGKQLAAAVKQAKRN